MRNLLILPLLLLPAALSAAPPVAKPVAPITLPPELADPKMAETMGRMMGAMSKVMLDMPVGELEAAIENRPATSADRKRKVRDVAGAGDPGFEQRLERQVAQSGPMIQGMTKALAASLPGMIAAMERAGAVMEAEIGKTVGNLPNPTYPKR